MSWRQWWASLRSSRYGDVPFVMLGVFIGWNCDVSCAVKGVSMVPTLHPGEHLLFVPYSLLRLRGILGVPLVRPSDVVVVRVSDTLSVCKRVVKCTSSRAEAEEWGGAHYVEVVPPPYCEGEDEDEGEEGASVVNAERAYYDHVSRHAVRSKDWDICTERVLNPSQWLWLEGDNKPKSFDSRRCGPVPVECVRGLVLAAIWPRPHRLAPAPAAPLPPAGEAQP